MSGQILDFNSAARQGEPTRHTVDVEDVRARLEPRAFVDWLFSGRAYITRNQARVGNVQGEQGSSLAIDLTTGLWKDHATDEGGDLISLYRAWAGYQGNADFALSLKEIARDFLGDPIEIERSQWRPAPLIRIAEQKEKLGNKPRDENVELGAPVATYTYYDLHGNVVASVVRFEPDGTRGSKTFRPWCFRDNKWVQGAPDLRPLYRLPEIATSQHIVLCEGEGKADALTKVGILATSAMQGAKAPLDKTDWSPLAGKTVTIWPDNDEAGFGYARNVAGRLKVLGCTVLGVSLPADAPPKWDAADCIAEGKDPHELIRNARPVEDARAPRPRITMLDIDDLESLKPPSWLIDGVLTKNGLSMLWGRSGALKSFVALDMALSVAAGRPWHGKAVDAGMVVYIAAEGASGFGQRVIGWRFSRAKDLPKPKFKMVPHPITMTSDDVDALLLSIADLPEQPVMIVLDTLARTFGNGDENKQADMNAYVTAADRLRDATGANVMIIHHSGVHEDRRERGSNVLRGAADTVIKVARKNDNLDIINEAPEGKQKDAEEFKTIKLRSVQICFPHGEAERTTLIMNLREDSDTAEPDGDAVSTKIGKNEQAILDALKRADQPLGFMRFKTMLSGINDGSLSRSLDNLVKKNLVSVDLDSSGNTKLWSLVCSNCVHLACTCAQVSSAS